MCLGLSRLRPSATETVGGLSLERGHYTLWAGAVNRHGRRSGRFTLSIAHALWGRMH